LLAKLCCFTAVIASIILTAIFVSVKFV